MSEVWTDIDFAVYVDVDDFIYFAKMWDEVNRKSPFDYDKNLSFDINSQDDVLCYKRGANYKMSFSSCTFNCYCGGEEKMLKVLKNIAQTRPNISFDVHYSVDDFRVDYIYKRDFSYCDNKFEIESYGELLEVYKLTEKGFKEVPQEVWNSKKEIQIPVYTFDKNNMPETDQINVLIDKNTVAWCLQNMAETVEYKKPCILIDFIDSPFQVVALNSNSGKIIFEIYRRTLSSTSHIPDGIFVWYPQSNKSKIVKYYEVSYHKAVKSIIKDIIDAYKAVNNVLFSNEELSFYETGDLFFEGLYLYLENNELNYRVNFYHERPSVVFQTSNLKMEMNLPTPFDRNLFKNDITNRLLRTE